MIWLFGITFPEHALKDVRMSEKYKTLQVKSIKGSAEQWFPNFNVHKNHQRLVAKVMK